MLSKNRPHDLALHADPSTVDDPHLAKALRYCLIEIFLHDDLDLFRLKRVEVDGILDRQFVHPASIMVGL